MINKKKLIEAVILEIIINHIIADFRTPKNAAVVAAKVHLKSNSLVCEGVKKQVVQVLNVLEASGYKITEK